MEKNLETKKMECGIAGSIIFYIPLFFAISTRFLRRSKLGVIVWTTEYLIPVLLSMLTLSLTNFNIVTAIIAILSTYNLYEIGYIQNDCETIKKETKPTRRLSESQLNYYESHKYFIYGFRFLIGLGATVLFVSFGIGWYGICVMWLVIPYYCVYNYLRKRVNLYLLLPLITYRYCFPLYLYGNNTEEQLILVLIILFVAYPLPTFIEICSDGKGNHPEKWTKLFMRDFEKRFIFRVWYYLVLSLICILFAFWGFIPFISTIVPIFYLLDRTPQLNVH